MQTGADYSFDYLMEEGKPANIKKNTGNLLENAPIKYQESVSSAKDLYPIFNKAFDTPEFYQGENDTLACGQSSHKTTMNKRKCSLSLSPAETHCTARVAGGLLIIDHVL